MRQQEFTITESDKTILLSLCRFHYLTAAQLSRLVYPKLHDENRYAQRRLKRLADAGYVMRLRALPEPQYGQAPHVFTLRRKGRQLLDAWGVDMPSYYRPSEEIEKARNNPFMAHTLAAIDVLIAADRLCQQHPVTCPQVLSERALKATRVYVNLPIAGDESGRTRKTAVIPDAWFQLAVASQPLLSIALELDRATQKQKAWRQKVHALTLWAQGPYRQAFDTDNLTIAVVTPTTDRRDDLRAWTYHELAQQQSLNLADIFLFTATSPASCTPAQFFFGSIWYLPHEPQPVSLLDPPAPVATERQVSLHAV
jgi:hypothetical protein